MLALLIGAAAACAALLFALGAAAKLRHARLLPAVIANYRLLPPMLVAPAAVSLPAVEALLALALLLPGRPAAIAAVPAIGLLLVFAGAMAINLRRGRGHIDCGCGIGGLRQALHPALVWRNVALAAALVPLALTPGRLDGAGQALALLAGAAAALLLLFLDALLALLPRARALLA